MALTVSAFEGPDSTARLYCQGPQGAALPLHATYADLVAAYERKVGWKPSVKKVSPTGFDIAFSPPTPPAETEVVTFHAESVEDALVIGSIDYDWHGDAEHVGKGHVCIRMNIVLGR